MHDSVYLELYCDCKSYQGPMDHKDYLCRHCGRKLKFKKPKPYFPNKYECLKEETDISIYKEGDTYKWKYKTKGDSMSEEKKKSPRELATERLIKFVGMKRYPGDTVELVLKMGLINPTMTMSLIDKAFPDWDREPRDVRLNPGDTLIAQVDMGNEAEIRAARDFQGIDGRRSPVGIPGEPEYKPES